MDRWLQSSASGLLRQVMSNRPSVTVGILFLGVPLVENLDITSILLHLANFMLSSFVRRCVVMSSLEPMSLGLPLSPSSPRLGPPLRWPLTPGETDPHCNGTQSRLCAASLRGICGCALGWVCVVAKTRMTSDKLMMTRCVYVTDLISKQNSNAKQAQRNTKL